MFCSWKLVSWNERDAVDEGRRAVAIDPEVCRARKPSHERDVVITRCHDSTGDELRPSRHVTQRDRRRARRIDRPALDAPLLVCVDERCAAELLVAVGGG